MQTIYIDGHFRTVGGCSHVISSSSGTSGGSSADAATKQELLELKQRLDKLTEGNDTPEIDTIPEVYTFLLNFNNSNTLDEVPAEKVDSLF